MAKQGLSYYQAETDRFQDIKVKRLKKKFGCEGFAVYTYIENEIYRNAGCYIRVTEDITFDISEYWNIEEEQVEAIISFCADIELFDPLIYKTRSVLTSERIQQKYVSICKHAHKTIVLPEEIRLIDIKTEKVLNPVTLPLFGEDNQPEPATGTPQYGTPTLQVETPQTAENQTQEQPFANFRETSRKTREKIHKRKENKINSPSIPLTAPVPGEKEEAEKLFSRLQGQLTPPITAQPHEQEDEKAPKRNENGLYQQMGALNIPPNQMRDICRLCRYGEIGHPVWTLFDEIRRSRGRITMPGLFIISRLKQAEEAGKKAHAAG